MTTETQIIEADLTWTGEEFEPDTQVVVAPDGRIEHVGMLDERPTHRLTNQALIPGFVNAHSHAFQRGLRGFGETFPQGRGSFWTWREAMYELVDRMDTARMYELSRRAFSEMLAAGITTVGEFHYLHHDASCRGYALDDVVLDAARDAGIRIVLLQCYYRTGGVGEPLQGGQRRFETKNLDEFWSQFDRLAARLDARTQSMGVAPHSLRAVTPDELVLVHQEASRRGLVMHMHVEEQPKEVQQCIEVYGRSPMSIVNDRLNSHDRFTAIHCTQTSPREMRQFAGKGGRVCLCPLTEGNLGDGIADVTGMRAAGARICVGTDSNARLCMAEELRWLEYVQRLRRQQRGIVCDSAGRVAGALLRSATASGADALGIRTGVMAPGYFADFASIDLSAPALAGWTPQTLLETLIVGAGNDAIASACVGGHWITPTKPRSS